MSVLDWLGLVGLSVMVALLFGSAGLLFIVQMLGAEPCPFCGCPGKKFDGHACEDFFSEAADSQEPPS